MGYHHGYRKAKVPKPTSNENKGEKMDEDEEEEEEEDDFDDDDYDCPNWPEKAHHNEDYFGYMFDAGNHRICE